MVACFEVLAEHLRAACQAADHAQALLSLSLALGVVETSLVSRAACPAPLTPARVQVRHPTTACGPLRCCARLAELPSLQ